MIYSNFENKEKFDKLKKTRWKWEFLVDTEFSDGPYHQGDAELFYAINHKKELCAILLNGFPKQILCISDYEKGKSLAKTIAEMMFHSILNDHLYYDMVNESCDNEELTFFEVEEELEKLENEHNQKSKSDEKG